MLPKKMLMLLAMFISAAMASSIMPRRYNIFNRLSNQNVDVNRMGCKCIMTAPTRQNTDSTMCMCFNRKDGTINNTNKCRLYTDTVFGFCTDVTDDTKLWQKCVKHYCPCTDANMKNPPKNKLYF